MGRFVLNYQDQQIVLRKNATWGDRARVFARISGISVWIVLMFNVLFSFATGIDLLQRFWLRIYH